MFKRVFSQVLKPWRKAADKAWLEERVSAAMQIQTCGRVKEAEAIYRTLIDELPRDADIMHLLASNLMQQGRHDEAVQWLEQVTALMPQCVEAYYNFGGALNALGQSNQALRNFDKAIDLNPGFVEGFIGRGNALAAAGKLKEAELSYKRALDLRPHSPAAHINCGIISHQLGNLAGAIEHFLEAIAVEPANADALYGLGWALYRSGKTAESIAPFQRALEQRPECADFHYGYSMALLRIGEYDVGWKEYEWRFEHRREVLLRRPYAYPWWDGAFSETRCILVWGEQGLGDEIMFASCLPDLIAGRQHVLMECSPRLEGLFRRSFPQVTIYAAAEKPVLPRGFDEDSIQAQIAIGSLPQFLRKDVRSFPSRTGYLQADHAMRAHWRDRLDSLGPGMKIGLSWQGGTPRTNQADRSMALQYLLPILRSRSCHFVSLQYTDVRAELSALASSYSIVVTDFADTLYDFDQLAALVCELDLVISVCTSVVHLAGALGRPVWIMVPYSPEWRYGIVGETMPWYPSARLFRQQDIGMWDSVIETVAQELKSVIPVNYIA